jgi:hypothetical protein
MPATHRSAFVSRPDGSWDGTRLYSHSRLLIDSPETLLASDRVFVGTQPDDFALAGVRSRAEHVCILGLGYGAAIRGILAVAPMAKITAVELDHDMATLCKSVFAKHFPHLAFDVVCADARQFLREHRAEFDAACVDLYDDDGHPAFVCDPDFWRLVEEATAADGCMLANVWGLPEHLDPFASPSPQAAVTAAIRSVWPDAQYVPSRRNMTVFAGACAPAARPDVEALARLDQAVAALLPARARLARPLPEVALTRGPVARSRAAMNAEMARRWPWLVDTLLRTADDVGVGGPDFSLRRLLCDRAAGAAVLAALRERRAPEASYIPIGACALYCEEHDRRVEWFGEWVLEMRDELCRDDPAWFVNVALWQALAMATNPLAPCVPWAQDIAAMAIALELARRRAGWGRAPLQDPLIAMACAGEGAAPGHLRERGRGDARARRILLGVT